MLRDPLILTKCRYLNDYSTLVGLVRSGIATGLSRRKAILQAINYCINNGVMHNFLKFHSKEVFSVLTLEWNLNEAKQAWREDFLEEGRDLERESIARKNDP